MNPTEELAAGMKGMGRTGIIELLDAGADINVQDPGYGWTALIWMVQRSSLDGCTELLKRGANLQIQNHDGWTAWDCLGWYDDQAPFYSLFLQYGVDVNQYYPDGRTALHNACRFMHHSTIRLLLAQGADPSLPVKSGTNQGKTAYDLGTFWSTPDGIRYCTHAFDDPDSGDSM